LRNLLDTSTTKTYLHPTFQLYHEILILAIIWLSQGMAFAKLGKSKRELGKFSNDLNKIIMNSQNSPIRGIRV